MDKQNIIKEINNYIDIQSNLDTLRLITCGSVDDGKSTLLGRMLYEAKAIFDDEVKSLKISNNINKEDNIDYSLLLDGLKAEREQSITIDVAYRFFTTNKRKFIVADTPGHEQYTRNMFTGATTADLAIILIDSRYGILDQTRRHTIICSLIGIKNIVLAVNKMDLINFSESKYKKIRNAYLSFIEKLNFENVTCIPISAKTGCNIIEKSNFIKWYKGLCLLSHLETIKIKKTNSKSLLRFPIQLVNRPDQDFRGYSGTVITGEIKVGQNVKIQPLDQVAKIKDIITFDGNLTKAKKGNAITLMFDKDIDISRGNVVVDISDKTNVADQAQANIIWMDKHSGYVGRTYLLKVGPKVVNANITTIKHKININNFEKLSANVLTFNNIFVVTIKTHQKIFLDKYNDCQETGSFVLIDKENYNTVAAGMINFTLHRSNNLHKQKFIITKKDRNFLNGHKGQVLWFTGLSGSGKSTIANQLEKKLYEHSIRTFILDGDNIRHGLNNDIGFTDADRIENIRRVSEVAKLMIDAGLVIIVSFISPFRSEREMARKLFQKNEFLEIYINTPIEIAEKRDPKGLYKKARKGELPNFTGISSPYEEPQNPDLVIDTIANSIDECAEIIKKKIFKNSILLKN